MKAPHISRFVNFLPLPAPAVGCPAQAREVPSSSYTADAAFGTDLVGSFLLPCLFTYQQVLCAVFPLQEGQSSANGPSRDSPKQPAAREGHVGYPKLRAGYIPIPVIHEGLDGRQQHPCFSSPQQRYKTEAVPTPGQAQPPLRGASGGPESPARGPAEAAAADKQCGQTPAAAAAPATHGPEVSVSTAGLCLQWALQHLWPECHTGSSALAKPSSPQDCVFSTLPKY